MDQMKAKITTLSSSLSDDGCDTTYGTMDANKITPTNKDNNGNSKDSSTNRDKYDDIAKDNKNNGSRDSNNNNDDTDEKNDNSNDKNSNP